MNRGMRAALLFTAAAGAAYALLWALRDPAGDTPAGPPPLEQVPRVDLAQLPVSVALNNEMALIASRVMPGVVSIQVDRRKPDPPPLRPDAKPAQSAAAAPENDEPSVGSGTIVRKDGLVLTNWHVVEGAADSIIVTLHGEETARRAKLVDRDESRDLALLQIEPATPGEEFTALRFGDSSRMRVGHMVLAFGSPFGLRDTMTGGFISHSARRVSDNFTAYLQTDSVINPGNSGGPLVNLQGDVIGIVTRKLLGPKEEASAEGYGLAIPSNEARIVLDNLTVKGPQPYMGLTVEDWPERYWIKQTDPEAVIVKGVTRRAPAEVAGLKLGDIIESVDSERVTAADPFWRAVRRHRAGDKVQLTLRRGTEILTLSVALATLPESAEKPGTVRGVTVRPLRPFERSMLSEPGGLYVENVEPGSPFAGILTRRSNILRVSSADLVEVTDVFTPEQLETALAKLASTGGLVVTAKPGLQSEWLKFPALP
jgi:S1-C subfamily serine protease